MSPLLRLVAAPKVDKSQVGVGVDTTGVSAEEVGLIALVTAAAPTSVTDS